MWLAAYWQHFKPLTSEQKLEFVRLAGGFDTAVAKDILLDALSDDGDWRIIQAAALPLGRMKHKQAISPLEGLSSHPIIAVQITSLTALDGIKTGTMTGRAVHWRNALSSPAAYCSAPAKDFKDDAKGLPFFDLSDIDVKAAGDKRRFVSAIAALKSGFIVGFDAGTSGGDLRYYDNASGDSLPLKEWLSPQTQNITAIMPVIPVPLGQYANAFWLIAQSGPSTDQAKLYRLSGRPNNFNIKYQAELPHHVSAIAPQQNGDVFISFYKQGAKPSDVNPPLILSPNGAIRRACSAAADTAQALP